MQYATPQEALDAGEVVVWTTASDVDEMDAHIANAQFHLDMLRATIDDGLVGPSDLFLKVSLLQDLEAAQDSLRKALV